MCATTDVRRPSTWKNSLLGLVAFGTATAITAMLGALAAAGAQQRYAALNRPAWAPPGWLFGPVWTLLYATIALAGWLVWHQVGIGWPLVPYAVQLVLNAIWTPIFFDAGAYGLAAVDIILLWCAVAVTVVVFHQVHRAAAVLLLPYWAWTTFATALNLAIWWANR